MDPATVVSCGHFGAVKTAADAFTSITLPSSVIQVTDEFTNQETPGFVADYSIKVLQNISALFVYIKQDTLAGLFKIAGATSAGVTISGDWWIDGPGNPGSAANIKKNEYSGVEFFYAPEDPGVGIVPLPAGLPLLLGAMGVFGVVARRRKAA